MQYQPNQLHRVKAVAERLDVSVHTVYRAINDGRLDALRIGKAVRITESAITAFLNTCSEAAYQAFVIDGQPVATDDQAETAEVTR